MRVVIPIVALIVVLASCSDEPGKKTPEGVDAGEPCSDGLTRCGAICTDLTLDPSNCGTCGNSCRISKTGTRTCSAGSCLL